MLVRQAARSRLQAMHAGREMGDHAGFGGAVAFAELARAKITIDPVLERRRHRRRPDAQQAQRRHLVLVEFLPRQRGDALVHRRYARPGRDLVMVDEGERRCRIEAAQQHDAIAETKRSPQRRGTRPMMHGQGQQHDVARDLRTAGRDILQIFGRPAVGLRRLLGVHDDTLGQPGRARGVDHQGRIAFGEARRRRLRQQFGKRDEALGRRVDRHRKLDVQPVEGGLQGGRIGIVADHHRGTAVAEHILRFGRRQAPVQGQQRAAQLGQRRSEDPPVEPDLGAQHDDIATPHAVPIEARGDAVRRIVPGAVGQGAVALDDRNDVGLFSCPVFERSRSHCRHAARLR